MPLTRLALHAVVLSVALTGFCDAATPNPETCGSVIQGLQCKARKIVRCMAETAECPAGFRLIPDANLCAPCQAGSFKSSSRDHGCLKCPAGTFTGSSGSSQCTQCPAGSYSNSSGSSQCTQCPAGSYSNSSGSSQCTQCPAGSYSNSSGSSQCTQCPAGSCSDSPGSSQCKKCPAKTSSISPGRSQCYVLKRLGCFVDKKGDRDLPDFVKSNVNSPAFCVNYCESKGLLFAGVQAQTWCYCGNSFGRHGKVQDSECSMKCSGDNEQTCGSHWRNEVYLTLMRLGCFEDKSDRDLDGFYRVSNDMKPEYCVLLCKARGYRFAGVQATDWCHCGNSYGRHGQVADSECSLSCSGDKKQTCGSNYRNEVYATGL